VIGGLLSLVSVFGDRPGGSARVGGGELALLAVGVLLVGAGTVVLARRRRSGRWRPPVAALGIALVVLALTFDRFGGTGSSAFGWKQALLAVLGLGVAAIALVERPRDALWQARALPLPLVLVLAAGIVVRLGFMYAYRPGFFGFPDSVGYFAFANTEVFGTPYRPAGESMFIYALRFVSDELSFTVLAHHVLGVVTGLLLYLSCRRSGAGPWLSAVPAGVVLLGGTQIFLEHSTMSEPTFTALLAGGLYATVRARDGHHVRWLVLAGALAGAAAIVRVVGVVVLVALGVWVIFHYRERSSERLRAALALAAPAVLVLIVYLVAHADVTGTWGLTRTQGQTLYARTATFANCSEFKPPAGTERLCETRPAIDRPPAVHYQFAPTSPGLKAFGAPPALPQADTPEDWAWKYDDKVGDFARAAILGQPAAYSKTVAWGLVNFVTPTEVGPRSVSDWDTDDLVRNMRSSYEGSAQSFFPNYYATPAAFQRRSPGTLDAYGRHLRVEGPLTAVFVLLTLAGLTFGRGPLRRATVPFALAAGALMVATVAFLYYDVRYATPVFGFVAASAALGTGALIARRRGEPPVL